MTCDFDVDGQARFSMIDEIFFSQFSQPDLFCVLVVLLIFFQQKDIYAGVKKAFRAMFVGQIRP
jgi:hypothetical protein